MRYVLILLLALVGCAVCPHEHTFRRFTLEQGQSLRGNLLCRDCGASVVSYSFCHPFNRPSSYRKDDELLIIGGLDGNDFEGSEDRREEAPAGSTHGSGK